MKTKLPIIIMVLVVLLGVSGFLVYRTLNQPLVPAVSETPQAEPVQELDKSVVVTAQLSNSKANTVIVQAVGLAQKMTSVAYELSYESQGLIKGVNSGSKPIDITSEDEFEREVYLGTCSRNVCKPDTGVTKVTVILEFIDTKGSKSQFSGDFEL